MKVVARRVHPLIAALILFALTPCLPGVSQRPFPSASDSNRARCRSFGVVRAGHAGHGASLS